MARRTERDKEIRQVHSSLLTRSFNSTNLLIQEKNLHATDHYINILFYYKKTQNMKREHVKCFHLLPYQRGKKPDAS